jgi:hypothetical protein
MYIYILYRISWFLVDKPVVFGSALVFVLCIATLYAWESYLTYTRVQTYGHTDIYVYINRMHMHKHI